MNPYLSTLFSCLNDNGIEYFLLTDFESEFSSKDIDIFVYPNFKQAFEDAIFNLGWFRRKEPAFHVNHHFYISPKSDIYLDVKFTPTFASGPDECYTYSSLTNSTIEVTQNQKGVYRPKGIDAVMLYTAHLAYKERGKLEEKHRSYLAQYINLYRNEVDRASLEIIEQIEQWLSQHFPGNTGKLRQIIRPHFSFAKKRMTRAGGPKYGYGLSVLFLGTDGTGKTTLVEAVAEKLSIKNNRLYLGAGESSWSSQAMKRIYEHRFNLKPIDKVYNFIKTYAILPLELSIRILPVIKKSKFHITLIDRFPGFVFLDNKPGRASLYKAILPTPDLVIFLHAAPEVLVARKPHEVTLEKSRKDIQKFRKVAEITSNGKFKSVDTSNLTVEEARDIILSEIYSHPKLYSNLLTTEPN